LQASDRLYKQASAIFLRWPATFLLLLLFAAVYLPFLWHCGWGYLDALNMDLPSFYSASISAFKLGKSPYDPAGLQHLTDAFITFPFLYSPPSLLFFFPLSLISYDTARLLTLIGNHFILLAILWMIPLQLLRARPSTHFLTIATCIVYPLLCYPIALTIKCGQINLLLTLCLMLFWLQSRRGNTMASAFFLAVAIVLKTYPAILLIMLLLLGRRKEFALTCLWLAIAVATTLVIFPFDLWRDWLTQIVPSGGYLKTPVGLISPAVPENQGINSFFARAFTANQWSQPLLENPALGRLLAYCTAFTIIIVTATAVWRSRKLQQGFDRAMLAVLPATFLIAPFSWQHHITYLLPCILVILHSRFRGHLIARSVFFLLGIGVAAVLALEGVIADKFSAVVVLWILGVFTACCSRIELPIYPLKSGPQPA
jgi:hypothetical protein